MVRNMMQALGEEGQEIAGYRILRMIGRGGMGEVYLAEQVRLRRQVALKLIQLEAKENSPVSFPQLIEQFIREVQAIMAFEHQHILPLYDVGYQEGLVYIVTPYIPEGSLQDALRPGPRQRVSPPLFPDEALVYIEQAAEALQYAHDRNVIHRDIKPANLLARVRKHTSSLKQDPERLHLFLGDFGLAKYLSFSADTRHLSGTPAYMAPEQFQGRAGPASDQYSLAILSYYLLTGDLPFRGSPVELMFKHLNDAPPPANTIVPELPDALIQVILRGMAKAPEARFPSVMAFAQAAQSGLSKIRAPLPKLTLPTTAPATNRPATPPAKEFDSFKQGSVMPRLHESHAGSSLKSIATDYLNFDLDIAPGAGRNYPVSVRSPAGQAHGTMRFPYDTLELENYLLKLKNALLSSGGVRRKALTENEKAVLAFGQKLFEAALEGDLRSLFYESKREVARQGKSGLRVRLHIRAPELAGLPWEYLYDPRVPDYLCLSKKTPLVRYLDLTHPVEPLAIALPLRILVMTASPKDQNELNIECEQERIRKALGPLEAAGQVAFTWLSGQTARDLQRALQRGPWHVFHFIGHGDYDARRGEGVLALCNEQDKTALLYATQLARLLADHDSLRLTILNSCNGAKGDQQDVFSSTAATLAQFGLPAIVAMQEEITDDAATEWTRAFYEALATGLPVDTAVTEARLAISLQVNNSLEWGTPVLYLRASDGVLFNLSM